MIRLQLLTGAKNPARIPIHTQEELVEQIQRIFKWGVLWKAVLPHRRSERREGDWLELTCYANMAVKVAKALAADKPVIVGDVKYEGRDSIGEIIRHLMRPDLDFGVVGKDTEDGFYIAVFSLKKVS